MRLRLGMSVHATDGSFGHLADIVVDPTARTVTHIVVSPTAAHQQARLVPIWLVSVEAETANVALTAPHIRQLQRVAFEDFVPAKPETAVDEHWDLGSEDLIARPYWDIETLSDVSLTDISPSSPVAKNDCEIRRRSEVTTSDFYLAGHVEGFVASKNQVLGVVVQLGIPGKRTHKIVPMDLVSQVHNSEIILSMTKDDFIALPSARGLEEARSFGESIDLHGKRLVDSVRDSASRLAIRTRDRYRRKPIDDQPGG